MTTTTNDTQLDGAPRRDAALDALNNKVNAAFIEEVIALLIRWRDTRPLEAIEFTSDDIWDGMSNLAGVRDGRTLGAAMRTAAQMKIIKATGAFRNSTKASNHRRPVRIWTLVR